MITTNILEFVQQLNRLGDVKVHDGLDTIELQVAKPVDVSEVDDLVCDALFIDPVARTENQYGWTIHLDKREGLRHASDMRVEFNRGRMGYVLQPAA